MRGYYRPLVGAGVPPLVVETADGISFNTLPGTRADDMWAAQRDYFAKKRGFDWTAPPNWIKTVGYANLPPGTLPSSAPSGYLLKIPRTVNSDVVRLAMFWRQIAGKYLVGGRHVEATGREAVLERGHRALEHVEAIATVAPPTALYPFNDEFWRAANAISIQVAATEELPSKWSMIVDSVEYAVEQLPHTLEDAAKKFGQGAANVVKELFGPLALMIGGVALVGVLAYHFAVTKEK